MAFPAAASACERSFPSAATTVQGRTSLLPIVVLSVTDPSRQHVRTGRCEKCAWVRVPLPLRNTFLDAPHSDREAANTFNLQLLKALGQPHVVQMPNRELHQSHDPLPTDAVSVRQPSVSAHVHTHPKPT